MMKDEMTFRTFNFSKYYAGVLAEKRIADLQENDNNRTNAEKFAELIENYIGITELDYELVHTLIEKIYIHERENIDGKAVVKVDIYYRFVGNTSGEGNPVTFNRRL